MSDEKKGRQAKLLMRELPEQQTRRHLASTEKAPPEPVNTGIWVRRVEKKSRAEIKALAEDVKENWLRDVREEAERLLQSKDAYVRADAQLVLSVLMHFPPQFTDQWGSPRLNELWATGRVTKVGNLRAPQPGKQSHRWAERCLWAWRGLILGITLTQAQVREVGAEKAAGGAREGGRKGAARKYKNRDAIVKQAIIDVEAKVKAGAKKTRAQHDIARKYDVSDRTVRNWQREIRGK